MTGKPDSILTGLPARSMTRRSLFAAIGAGALAGVALAPARANSQTPTPLVARNFVNRLAQLLELAPTHSPSAGNPAPPFYYADLEHQLASVDLDQIDLDADTTEFPPGFREAVLSLPLAAVAYQRGLLAGWLPTFGFVPYAVHQTLTLNASPDVVTMFTGGFDPDRVRETLVSSGFEPVDAGNGLAVLAYPQALDANSDVFQLGVGTMGHAAIIGETAVFSQQPVDVERVAAIAQGAAPSMAVQEPWLGFAQLFSADTVGLIPMLPDALVAPAASQIATPMATPADGTAMGGLEYLAFGVRSGAMNAPLSLVGEGTPEATPFNGVQATSARIEGRIQYATSAQASEQAEAIPGAWQDGVSALTGQPYQDILALESAGVDESDDRVVALDFVTVNAVNSWIQLIQSRDLAPLLPIQG